MPKPDNIVPTCSTAFAFFDSIAEFMLIRLKKKVQNFFLFEEKISCDKIKVTAIIKDR